MTSSEESPSRRIEVEPIRNSVRAPLAVVSIFPEVTGQLTWAGLISAPTSPPMLTAPWASATRPTLAGGSSCAMARAERVVKASSTADFRIGLDIARLQRWFLLLIPANNASGHARDDARYKS